MVTPTGTLRHGGRVATLAILAFASACSLVPTLQPPVVTVAAVRVDRVGGGRADATVVLNVANPNAIDLGVAAAEASLKLEDVAFGVARLRSPLTVPANGSAVAELAIETDLASMLNVAAALARRLQDAPNVRYAVTGTATLANGQSVPFARSGEVPFGRNRAAPR